MAHKTRVYVFFDSEVYAIFAKKRDLSPIKTFTDYLLLEEYCKNHNYHFRKIHIPAA